MKSSLDIEDWRIRIDEIDEQLVGLLNRRSMCAIEIGRIKRERGMAIYSPDREAEVIDNVIRVSRGPLEPDAVRRVFERIIDESRRVERVTVEREGKGSAKVRGSTGKKKNGRRR